MYYLSSGLLFIACEILSFIEPRKSSVLSTISALLSLKGAVSRNLAKLGNYKMPDKLRET